MADDGKVFTLAVWDVGRRRWHAFVTSADRAFVQSVHDQLVSLVMVFAEIVEVGRDDDDVIEAAVGLLPKVHPEAVFRCYFDLVQFVANDEVAPGRSVRLN